MTTASCITLEQSNNFLLYPCNIEGLGLHAWHSHCQAYLTYFFASVPVHQQESTLSPKELVVQEDWVIKRTSVEKTGSKKNFSSEEGQDHLGVGMGHFIGNMMETSFCWGNLD